MCVFGGISKMYLNNLSWHNRQSLHVYSEFNNNYILLLETDK